MARAFLIVMDSVGIGGAPDAAEFGDEGSNTILHIAEACANGLANEGREGPLQLPNLDALGLGRAVELACGTRPPSLNAELTGAWAAATEHSPGKDTPTGHWELSGVPVPWEWHYFPDEMPSFPEEISQLAAKFAGTDGILGNCHASGTEIIERLGETHIKTGLPICYTSADSVFQIAAHESHFGLERLYQLCRDLAPTLHAMKVGRVIARPFLGESASTFQRTKNRKDFAIDPPAPTLLDWALDDGRATVAIGKISDIFSGRGVSEKLTGTDAELMQHLKAKVIDAPEGALVFSNFVEFDTNFGHRRDVAGYARQLEWFDTHLPALFAAARPGDLFLFTADHGNDPTWHGTEHTREKVPVLMKGAGARPLGAANFVDIGATIATQLKLTRIGPGRNLL